MGEICKMDKKGFTLIELVGVIIIVAILALITVSTISGVLTDSKESTFKDSLYALYKSGVSYYEENEINTHIKLPLVVKYEKEKSTYYTKDDEDDYCQELDKNDDNTLEYKGKDLESAMISIEKDGTIKIVAWNKDNKACYQMDSIEEKIIKNEEIEDKEQCVLDISDICTVK